MGYREVEELLKTLCYIDASEDDTLLVQWVIARAAVLMLAEARRNNDLTEKNLHLLMTPGQPQS